MNKSEVDIHLRVHGYDPERVTNAVVTHPGIVIQSDEESPVPLDQYRIAFDYKNVDGFTEHHDIVLGYVPTIG